ncbi:MAG: hypothetical protein ACRD0C_02735 [Acidimicrobiia bacterium]
MDPPGPELEPLEVAHHPPAATTPSRDRPSPRDRRRVVALGGAVVVLVSTVALGLLNRGGADGESTVEEAQPASWTGAPNGDEPAPAGWRRGHPGLIPSRNGAAVVWTGSNLLVWGGDPPGEGVPAGAAYDPFADRWRLMAPAPFPLRTGAAAAWTGFEMVLWGGYEPGRGAPATGGAYDPVADRWRTMAPAPLSPGIPVTAVWTGGQFAVLGVDPGLGQEVSPEAAAYDPAADRWRRLPPLPVTLTAATALWTGSEVVVIGAPLRPHELPADQANRSPALAYDPAGDRWRVLPSPPLASPPPAAAAVWTGDEIVAWDYELHAARFDPALGLRARWSGLPDLPLEFRDCEPQGAAAAGVVFAEHCGQGAVYRPGTNAWQVVPHPHGLSVRPVWTGDELLFWTGRFVASADGIWRYRVPPPRPVGPVPPVLGSRRR